MPFRTSIPTHHRSHSSYDVAQLSHPSYAGQTAHSPKPPHQHPVPLPQHKSQTTYSEARRPGRQPCRTDDTRLSLKTSKQLLHPVQGNASKEEVTRKFCHCPLRWIRSLDFHSKCLGPHGWINGSFTAAHPRTYGSTRGCCLYVLRPRLKQTFWLKFSHPHVVRRNKVQHAPQPWPREPLVGR
jgi:hypothetical protein